MTKHMAKNMRDVPIHKNLQLILLELLTRQASRSHPGVRLYFPQDLCHFPPTFAASFPVFVVALPLVFSSLPVLFDAF